MISVVGISTELGKRESNLRLHVHQKVVTLGYSSVWPWITKMEAPYSSKANRVMNHLLKKFKTMLQRWSWVK